MRDVKFTFENARMHAEGTITVDDWEALSGTTITVGSDTLTEGVDYNASTDNDTTATALAAAIDALSGVNAAAVANVITIKADAVGTAGNAKVLETNSTDAVTLSGATLEGGAAALYTDPFDLPEGMDSYEAVVTVTALDGGSPTADFTPEGSVDGGDSYLQAESEAEAALAFTQFTGTGSDKQYVKLASPRNRLKLVLGGTSPVISATVTFIARND